MSVIVLGVGRVRRLEFSKGVARGKTSAIVRAHDDVVHESSLCTTVSCYHGLNILLDRNLVWE